MDKTSWITETLCGGIGDFWPVKLLLAAKAEIRELLSETWIPS